MCVCVCVCEEGEELTQEDLLLRHVAKDKLRKIPDLVVRGNTHRKPVWKMGKASRKESAKEGKSRGTREDIPWPLVGGIIAIIIVLLAVLFAFTGPSRPRRGEADVLQSGPGQEVMKEYEMLVHSADEQLQLGTLGLQSAKEQYEQAAALLPEHPLAHFQLARVSLKLIQWRDFSEIHHQNLSILLLLLLLFLL